MKTEPSDTPAGGPVPPSPRPAAADTQAPAACPPVDPGFAARFEADELAFRTAPRRWRLCNGADGLAPQLTLEPAAGETAVAVSGPCASDPDSPLPTVLFDSPLGQLAVELGTAGTVTLTWHPRPAAVDLESQRRPGDR